MTEKAIKKAQNSKAMGLDNIYPVMMKHLGLKAIIYLTNIFNNVVNQEILPPICKVGIIIPLLKPKKPSDEGPRYLPPLSPGENPREHNSCTQPEVHRP